MIVVFVCGLIFGSFKQVFVVKFYRWEMFGTALIPNPSNHSADDFDRTDIGRLQSVANLIADWNLEEDFSKTDEIDQEEIDAIKRSVG